MGDSKTERPEAKPQESLAFNHLLQTILQDKEHDGALIGELHNSPALRQSLAYLAPLLKANDVVLVSLEMPQEYVKAILNAKSLEDFQKSHAGKKYQQAVPKKFRGEEYYHLVIALQNACIEVIGHEDPDMYKPFLNANQELVERAVERAFAEEQKKIEEEIKSERDPEKRKSLEESKTAILEKRMLRITDDEKIIAESVKLFKEYGPESPSGMRSRNAYAAKFINDYVKEHKISCKKLVLGGLNHSERFGPERWPGSPSTERDGLDKALNLVAITINRSDKEGKVGATKKTTADMYVSKDSFEVILPEDIKEFFKKNTYHSWPPADGIPTIENIALQKGLPKNPQKLESQDKPHDTKTLPPHGLQSLDWHDASKGDNGLGEGLDSDLTRRVLPGLQWVKNSDLSSIYCCEFRGGSGLFRG